jgi:hypothetical protein
MSKISITNLENVISKCENFDEIKTTLNEQNIQVRENSDYPSLYLVVSKNVEGVLKNDVDVEGVSKNGVSEMQLTDVQKEANGIIFEKETNRVICMSQNKFETVDTFNDATNVYIEYCEDGTAIRLYNYNDEWITSTSRCIDAKKSVWSANYSFDKLFYELFDSSRLESLDKNKTYIFILIHSENRIVVKHHFNNLIYIQSIDNRTYTEDFTNIFFDENPKRTIRRTKIIPTESFTGNVDYDPSKRGIIVKKLIGDSWKIIKYDFPQYTMIKSIRGNTANIKVRYLELLNNPEQLQYLEQIYSEYKNEFSSVKYSLVKLYKEIHQLYFNSHIKHEVKVEIDNKFYQTLRQLHGEYKTKGTKITLEEVKKKVNSLDSHVIRKFLNL